MDRRNLVEELQKAFNDDSRQRATKDLSDVEYMENTKSLRVNEQKTYEILNKEKPEAQVMTEEELFGRLLKERRGK